MRGNRLGFLLAGTLLAVPAMAGCGGDDGASGGGAGGASGGGGGGEEAGGGEQTIRYAWWGAGERNERTQAVIDLFMAANPDITVEGETGEFVSHWERLTVQSAANGAACVPQMQSRFMADFSSRGVLRPLDPLVEDGTIDVSGVPDVILDTGRGEDGQLYNAITGVYFFVQTYNADMVATLGMEPPDNDMTWEEWEAWLRDAATKVPEGTYAADLYPATEFGGSFFNYVYGEGEEVFGEGEFAFDPQLLVDWWTMWDNLRQDGVTIPTEMLLERSGSLEEIPISTGKVLWNSQAQNQLPQINAVSTDNGFGEIKIAKLPNGPEAAGDTFGSNGLSLSTSCTDEQIPAGAKFIDFFVNDPEAAKAYGSTNGAVSVEELQQAQIDDPETDPKLVEGLTLLQTVVEEYEPEGYLFPVGGRTASDAFTRYAQSVFLGQATPEEAAEAYIAEANAALAAGG